MLDINKVVDGDKLTIVLNGRLDTTTAPELESQVNASLSGITSLIFDISDMEYISSAGLRVLLSSQKAMNKQGSMKVCHPTDDVKEIFDVTGFSDILTIED
ncbi:MAG: STAS domain-containing protein [Lachnospiraceae bacterium]|nr:STAS domain-containing protein [Lachnospiraceae bacterium]